MATSLSAAGDLTIDHKALFYLVEQVWNKDDDKRSIKTELARLIAERIVAERWSEISAMITSEELVNVLRVSISAYVTQKLMGETR